MQDTVVIDGDAILSMETDGDCALDLSCDGEAGIFVPVYPNPYEGETVFTPSAQTQTVEVEGLMMPTNITINPIPSNYGLITWDGSTLTVS